MKDTIRVIIASTAINKNTGIAIVHASNDYQSARLEPLTIKSGNLSQYRMIAEGMIYFFDCVKDFCPEDYNIIFYTECRELIDDFNSGNTTKYKDLWNRINKRGIKYSVRHSSAIMSYVASIEKEPQ